MFFSGVFFGIPEFMARSFIAQLCAIGFIFAFRYDFEIAGYWHQILS